MKYFKAASRTSDLSNKLASNDIEPVNEIDTNDDAKGDELIYKDFFECLCCEHKDKVITF